MGQGRSPRRLATRSGTLAAQLDARRIELGWSVETLSQAVGCASATTARLLRGDEKVALRTVIEHGMALGLSEVTIYLPSDEQVHSERELAWSHSVTVR